MGCCVNRSAYNEGNPEYSRDTKNYGKIISAMKENNIKELSNHFIQGWRIHHKFYSTDLTTENEMKSYLAIALENKNERILNSYVFTINEEVIKEKLNGKTILEFICENESYVKTLVNNYNEKFVITVTDPETIDLYTTLRNNLNFSDNLIELEKVIILKQKFL